MCAWPCPRLGLACIHQQWNYKGEYWLLLEFVLRTKPHLEYRLLPLWSCYCVTFRQLVCLWPSSHTLCTFAHNCMVALVLLGNFNHFIPILASSWPPWPLCCLSPTCGKSLDMRLRENGQKQNWVQLALSRLIYQHIRLLNMYACRAWIIYLS